MSAIGVWASALAAAGVAAYYAPALVIRRAQVARLRRRAVSQTGATLLALTYDDGPDREVTPELLAMLAERRVRATFFLVGSRAAEAPDVCDRIVAEGHEVATHSQRHKNAWKLGPISAVRDAMGAYGPLSRWCDGRAVFRPPFGKTTTPVLLAMAGARRRVIWWTHVGGDTSDPLPGVAETGERLLREGGVVLLHNRHLKAERREYVLELTRFILDGASHRGVELCPLSRMLGPT